MEHQPETATKQYELVRKAGRYEVLTDLFHDLGIQSNILISAKYVHSKGFTLTPAILSKAVLDVINEHPCLWLIGVRQPSKTKEGNHRLWEARLPALIFTDCVEFINVDRLGESEITSIYEKIHNTWFNTKDQTKPRWKVAIVNGVNGTEVIFISHHSVGDGMSGYAFHRSLLASLNMHDSESVEVSLDEVSGASETESPPPKHPPPSSLDQLDDKLSWLFVIYGFLFWQLIRLVINQRYFLFSNAVYSKTFPTVKKPLSIEERTVTKVERLRIQKGTMEKCLAACREHNTSFTALLHTLIQITLASDVYPDAEFGFSRVAVNIRPLLRVDPGLDIFANAASQYGRVQRLGKYRTAGSGSSPPSTDSNSAANHYVEPSLVWELAASYKAGMNNSIHKTRDVVQDFLLITLIGEDDEDIGNFYGLGLYQNNSFLISNLGVFKPRENMIDGGWSIQEVGFSAGAVRAAVGDIGIGFMVSSVQNGDCVICATYENGVLIDEMVRTVLEAVYGRLNALL